MVKSAVCGAMLCVMMVGVSRGAVVTTWDASTGLRPDQTTEPWDLIDDATPEDPVLSGGMLTLSTSTALHLMDYIHIGADIDMPSMLVIEADVRYVSGSDQDASRSGVGIGFTTAPTVGNYLFLDLDRISLNSSDLTSGVEAAVDTDGAFHRYRIEVTGVAAGSAIRVFQDGVLRLTGATFSDIDFNGPEPRVLFGDPTMLETGTSEWKRVSHNAYAVTAIPEPASAAMMVLVVGAMAFVRRRG